MRVKSRRTAGELQEKCRERAGELRVNCRKDASEMERRISWQKITYGQKI